MGRKEKFILREYVKNFILEDGDGGGAGDGFGGLGGYGGGMGMGGGLGIGDDLIYKTFVKGWVDLFKTATSATKSIAGSARMVIETTLEFAKAIVIPFYKGRYEKVFQKHRQLQNEIRQEYEPVYKSITQALASNDDFLVSAFMYDPSRFFDTALSNPSTFVTTFSALNAPDAIGNALDMLSGGAFGEIMEKVFSSRASRDEGKSEWSSIVKNMKQVLSSQTIARLFGRAELPEARKYCNFVIVEDEKRDRRDVKPDKKGKQLDDKTMSVMKAMLNPAVIKLVLESKEVQDMMKASREATEETLGTLVNDIQRLMKASKISDIEQITGKKMDSPDEISPDLESQIVNEMKQSVKAMYAKMLKSELSHLLKSVPKEHGLVQAYLKALKAIEQA